MVPSPVDLDYLQGLGSPVFPSVFFCARFCGDGAAIDDDEGGGGIFLFGAFCTSSSLEHY